MTLGHKMKCCAISKKGTPCKYTAKYGDYCGVHNKKTNSPNACIESCNMLKRKVFDIIQILSTNPGLLEERHPEMRKKLDAMCGNGQGLGNKATDQEACFAVVIEKNEFQPWIVGPNGSVPNTPGLFYKYQVGGTQRSLDFQLLEVLENGTIDFVNWDLKRAKSDSIFLNDGKFLDNVVYVISFTRSTKIKGQRKNQKQNICAIVRGQDVMTEKDKERMARRVALIQQLNEEDKLGDFLLLYTRNANQYSCKQFTDEFLRERTALLLSWLLPSLPQTELEPHSQSVESHL